MSRTADLIDTEPSDLPFSGKPLRNKVQADPRLAAPTLALDDLPLLYGRGRVHTMGTGDLRAPLDRPGSSTCSAFPSRRGNLLYYPDGRVTDLNGNPATAAEVPRCSLPDSVDQLERIRRIADARAGMPGRNP